MPGTQAACARTGTIFEAKQNAATPAPNAYARERHLEAGRGGPRQTIGCRYKQAPPYVTPAPNAYADAGAARIKQMKAAPRYSIKPKTTLTFVEKEVRLANKVAPNQYDVQHRPKPAPQTIGERAKPAKLDTTPAPNQYVESAAKGLVFKKRDPKFTMKSGRRPIIDTRNQAALPAPNSYDTARKGSRSGRTIGTGKRLTFQKSDTPAPNSYDCDIKKFDKTKNTAPIYTMGSRYSNGQTF